MATKDRDRIRQLREEANALRKAEESRKRRSRMVAQLGIVFGAVVVIAGIVALVVFGPRWFSKQVTPEAAGEASVVDSAGDTKSVPVRVDDENKTVVVGKDSAQAKIDFYFDFSCPHCVDYHDATEAAYEQLVADGDLQITYHPVRVVADYGLYAASGLLGTLDSNPGLFYDYLDGVFAVPAQTQVGWSYADYADYAQKLGVTDKTVLDNIRSGNYGAWVQDATEKARAEGMQGTPSIKFNGTVLEDLPTTLDGIRDAFGIH